jgi:hypothetical protein
MVQSALYGTERLSREFHISHAIALVVIGMVPHYLSVLPYAAIADDVASVWRYEREGAIQSCGINFVQDLPYFLVLLLAFQRFATYNPCSLHSKQGW